MIQTIKKAWAIPELRKKLVFTALILLIFRIGNAIPVPYVNTELLGDYLNQLSTTVLGLYNVMSGGAFAQATVFALGVQPYINSSIIIQLLTIAIPALERMAREGGEEGKKKIQSITRYATVAIAILQGWGYYALMSNYGILTNTGIWAALVIIVSFIAGSSFVMWMGEQITEFGIGNGISIILFAGILSRVPSMVGNMATTLRTGDMAWWMAVLVVAGILALIVLITWVNGAERRIPVQYAKRQVGRKMYGGQNSTLPMKVNMSGVLPIIFAQSIAMIIPTVAAFLPAPEKGTFGYALVNAVDSKSVLYMIFYFLMIIAFSYFYATIQFNPVEISNNLKKNGGFIPGFRPGKPTADFIRKVLNKVTLFGAIYLGVVAILPLLIGKIVNVAALSIGGTSVIIVVGVALETVQALESQMLMRQYKGFLEELRCIMKLILLGAPGAGKGTQADIIKKTLGIPTISTGNILRAAVKNGTPTGLRAKEYMDAGKLVPDDVIIGIISERLQEPDCADGYILDGVPRTIAQAEALEQAGIRFDAVVAIEIPDERIVARMGGRRVCESCGASYHVVNIPPKKEGICDVCGGALKQRKDDDPETVKDRLAVYHKETEPLKDFYEARGILKTVDDQPTVAGTTQLILRALGVSE